MGSNSTATPVVRSRHCSAPTPDRQKKTILLFGSFTLSVIKPHQLSKSETVMNKSHEYNFPHQPATFSSVLNSMRAFSSSRHIDPARVTKIFIAIDYKHPEKAETTSLQKEKFLGAFSVLVNVINTDLYPGTVLIFQSILPKSGLLKEIKERNRWFQEAVETSQGTWCQFMDCSKDFLTDRGDVNSKLYNNGPEASKRNKARLLSEQGMKVLIERYQTFLKLDDRFVSFESPNNQIPFGINGDQNSPDDIHFEESASNSCNVREEYLTDSPAMPVMDLSSLIGEMSKATAKINEITKLVTDRRVEAVEEHLVNSLISDDEAGRKALESCAETLVNTGMTYLEKKFDEFYKTAVIGPMATCQNDMIDKLTNMKFKCDADTDFIDPKMEEFKRQIQTESMQSVAKLAISNVGTFRRANQQLYHFRRRTEDALRQNEREFTKLTKTVNFSSDEEASAHLEQIETLLTKLEEVFD